jgi:starvation-inducible outer membrane lipoprotein
MNRRSTALGLCAMALLAGCASGPPFIDQAQPEAMTIAQPASNAIAHSPSAVDRLFITRLLGRRC